MSRKALPKKIRFEVFKRDKFTCQYCGRMSPDVILEVDHIKPVAEGGENDLLNLVTSCRDCNRGKGKTRISKSAELKKQQNALKELAERKEQTEMMMEWRLMLSEMHAQNIEYVDDYIQSISEYALSDAGKAAISKLIHQFSLPELIDAVDIAFDYCYNGDKDSWEKAFSKLGGICYNRRYRSGNL